MMEMILGPSYQASDPGGWPPGEGSMVLLQWVTGCDICEDTADAFLSQWATIYS